jgi:hypothetical protein
MANLLIRMPAEDAAALYTGIDAAARHQQKASPDDKRTLDQLRADVLAGLGWSALRAGHLGCCHPACGHVNQRLGAGRGRPATVNVSVAYTTLIGTDDRPAHLHGHGPITAAVARRIAAHGTWRRLLTDPVSGAVLDVGRSRHTPPPDLADHVTARDHTCRFPTCTRPAETCDLDHSTPWERGGSTSAANLGPLHRGHHNDQTTTAGNSNSPNPAGTSGPHPPDTSMRSTPRSSDSSPNPHPRRRARTRLHRPTPTHHRSEHAAVVTGRRRVARSGIRRRSPASTPSAGAPGSWAPTTRPAG